MKIKFNNSQVAITKFIIDNLKGSNYEVSSTTKGNLMFRIIG